MKKLIAVIVSAFILATPTVAAQDSTPTSTPEPVHERCIAVTSLPNVAETDVHPDRSEDEHLIADIELGLAPGVTMDNAWVVKSDDYDNVWFVSAQLHGEALDDDTNIATWATNRITEDGEYNGTGLIFSVDGFATEFSDWGDGGQTDAKMSINDDGVEDSQDCAEGD